MKRNPSRAEVAAALRFWSLAARPPDPGNDTADLEANPASAAKETTDPANHSTTAIERARDRRIARLASRGIKHLEHGHPEACRDCFRRLAGLIAERPAERVLQLEVQRGLR